MAEIVNLNRARKAKAKVEKARQAETNRVRHGTPKALRKLTGAQKEQTEQRLAGHRLENKDEHK